MNFKTLYWFWNKAINGKYRYRPWKLFFKIFGLELKSILLTGFTIDELDLKNNNK